MERPEDERVAELLQLALASARRVVGAADMAEDAAQDAMVTLLDHLPALREETVGGWVWVTARNKAHDLTRAAGRPPLVDPTAMTALSMSDRAAVRIAVDEALDAIPPHLAAAVRMSFDDPDGKRSAARLRITHGAYRKRLTDARSVLREILPDDPDWLIPNALARR